MELNQIYHGKYYILWNPFFRPPGLIARFTSGFGWTRVERCNFTRNKWQSLLILRKVRFFLTILCHLNAFEIDPRFGLISLKTDERRFRRKGNKITESIKWFARIVSEFVFRKLSSCLRWLNRFRFVCTELYSVIKTKSSSWPSNWIVCNYWKHLFY